VRRVDWRRRAVAERRLSRARLCAPAADPPREGARDALACALLQPGSGGDGPTLLFGFGERWKDQAGDDLRELQGKKGRYVVVSRQTLQHDGQSHQTRQWPAFEHDLGQALVQDPKHRALRSADPTRRGAAPPFAAVEWAA